MQRGGHIEEERGQISHFSEQVEEEEEEEEKGSYSYLCLTEGGGERLQERRERC